MAEVPIFQVDVFTSESHLGNPAAVCPVPAFLEDSLLQSIARENNLSETAFIVPTPDEQTDFDLKWFTPNKEVDICGHATIAAASVILNYLEPDWNKVSFNTSIGMIEVEKFGGLFGIRLPMIFAKEIEEPERLQAAMGPAPITHIYYTGDLYHLVYANRHDVEMLEPNIEALRESSSRGFIASAIDDSGETDFVTRSFYPALDIAEDAVTMSAYCLIAPHYQKILTKNTFLSHQISQRGGQVWMTVENDEIMIKGEAALISQGSLFITGID